MCSRENQCRGQHIVQYHNAEKIFTILITSFRYFCSIIINSYVYINREKLGSHNKNVTLLPNATYWK